MEFEKTAKEELQFLHKEAEEFSDLVMHLLVKYYNYKPFPIPWVSKIRLLRLKTLCETNFVDLVYALKILMRYWQAQPFCKQGRVPLDMLTGQVSKELLKTSVQSDFPSKENRKEWNQKQQKKEILLQFKEELDLESSYIKKNQLIKTEWAKERSSRRNRLRHFRGNPWLDTSH